MVILDGQGEVGFTQTAMEKLRWQNPFLTTTAAGLGRGERWLHFGETGMMEMGWAIVSFRNAEVTEMGCMTWCMYLVDRGVDRFQVASHHAVSQIILLCNELHTQCFPTFDLTCSVRGFVNPHGRVESFLNTPYLLSVSQIRFVPRVPVGCPERCSRDMTMGSNPCSSDMSPHHDGESLEMDLEVVIKHNW